MANKRMFSSSIIDSDAFIEMSPMARLLYINLSMHADDDGFTNSTKREMRIIGASDSDLDELVEKRFVIRFDSGVVAIKHWRINNTLRSDRYKETTYTEEKSLLTIEPNGAYTMKKDDFSVGIPSDNQQKITGIPSDNQCEPQNRVEENRVDKTRLEETRLDESRTCVHESPSESQALPGQPLQESPIVYFPTKFGEQPIYQRDIDDLSNMFNGSVDVRNEIFSCMAYYSDKPESVSSWQSTVKVWINRTINFNNATKFAIEQGMAKNNGRNHRSMEPDKYKDIIPEDAGL